MKQKKRTGQRSHPPPTHPSTPPHNHPPQKVGQRAQTAKATTSDSQLYVGVGVDIAAGVGGDTRPVVEDVEDGDAWPVIVVPADVDVDVDVSVDESIASSDAIPAETMDSMICSKSCSKW